MDELLQAHRENTGETRLYEVGYHLVPTIAEEAVAEAAGRIKDRIAARGGALSGEEMPKRTHLAYALPRMTGNTRTFFDTSYFGCVRFEMSRENAPLLERDLKEDESVMRFLLLQAKVEKVASTVTRKMPFFGAAKAAPATKENAGTPKEQEARHGALSEAELDKTIEELIAG